jgi:hypothetical protein
MRPTPEGVTALKRFLAVVLCALVVMAVGAHAAVADPDPEKNKNAVIITFTCGDEEIQTANIGHNLALAVQLVDGTGVLITVHITAIDKTTGEVLFVFDVPGFDHNKQETTTCTFTLPADPNIFEFVEVFFRPSGN